MMDDPPLDAGAEDDDDDDLPPTLDVEEVIVLYRHLLASLGLQDLEQCLGDGLYGAAYQVERATGPRVLKLTSDANEAVACAHLVVRPCPHVVRVFRVAALPDTVVEEDFAGWFVIERELLDPPLKRDVLLMNALEMAFEDFPDLVMPTSRSAFDRWRSRLRELLEPAQLKRAMWLLRDIGAGAAELGQLGLEWTDLHAENFMRRQGSGQYVICDPGPGVVTGWKADRPVRMPAFRAGPEHVPQRPPPPSAAAAR